MTDETKFKAEIDRVQALLADAVAGVEADGGDVRIFNSAYLISAIQLHIEVEGGQSLLGAISKIATRELSAAGEVGRC